MRICPRNAGSYGHTITDEKAADEWCQRTQKGQHCEGCERNKPTHKDSLLVQPKKQRRLF